MTALPLLIVEADRDLGRALQWALEDEGYQISLHHCAATALLSLSLVRPVVAVLDVTLPRQIGLEVAEELQRELDGCQAILIGAEEELGCMAQHLGAVGHLQMPFELHHLVAAVKRCAELGAANRVPASS